MKASATANRSQIITAVIIAAAIIVCVGAFLALDTSGKKGSGLGDQFTYDISGLAKVDPALINYHQVTTIGTSLAKVSAVDIDEEDNIYVAGVNGIEIYDNKGNKARRLEINGTPGCIKVIDDGSLYLGMDDHIEVYDSADGALKAKWQPFSKKSILTSVDVYEDNVFAADAGNRVVLRYDRQGNLLNKIGLKDPNNNIPGFVIPSPYFDLKVGSDGLLRVVNPGMHRIEAYTFDGFLELWWGKFSMSIEGFCGCCNPANFAFLSDGSFVTSEKGLFRVKIYDPDGIFISVVAGPEQLMGLAINNIGANAADADIGGCDIAVDSKDNVYVLDCSAGSVRLFSRKDVSK
jgi:hypothetical protein